MSGDELNLERDVLLFFEDRDTDTMVRGDRRIRRWLRKTTAFLRPNRQCVNGFEMSFILLCRALRGADQRVHINDYSLARATRTTRSESAATRTYSIVGNSQSRRLGPGPLRPSQAEPRPDERRAIQELSDAVRMDAGDVRDRLSSERIKPWFGGIDLSDWPDTAGMAKDVDVLVYDKIRWNRDTLVPGFRDPMLAELRPAGCATRSSNTAGTRTKRIIGSSGAAVGCSSCARTRRRAWHIKKPSPAICRCWPGIRERGWTRTESAGSRSR